MEALILTWGLAYVLGAVPVGRFIAKLNSGEDIWEYRDGTSSFSNLFYVLGTEVALVKVVLDLLKGVAVGGMVHWQGYKGLFTTLTLLVMILGYVKPLGKQGKEGSGVIPGLGFLWYLFPQLGGFSMAMFIAVLVLKRKLRPALTVGTVCLIIGSLWLGHDWVTISALLVSGTWLLSQGKSKLAFSRTFT
ncbi:MAG: glycerol-3-phosphate acyltransferase [Clostridia bacterium]|nr:glycerol-3-phosphate acyltransferase [Clostridia bacterium]